MTNRERSYPWDPATTHTTDAALLLVQEANEAQFIARVERSASVGKQARRNSGAKQEKELATVAAIVLDLLAHSLSGNPDPFVIKLDKNWLSAGPNELVARNRTVNDRVYDLEVSGWVQRQQIRLNNRFVTCLKPGPKLLKASQHHRVGLGDIGVVGTLPEIELKGRKPKSKNEGRRLLPFEPSSATTRTLAKLTRLSDHIARARLESVAIDGAMIDTRRRRLIRSFLDGSFERGGRLGGSAFWLNLRKEARRTALRIDGDHIAEVDIQAAMPSIAYALEGQRPVGDPYDLPTAPDIPRDAVKKALMQLLWTHVKKGTPMSAEARKLVPQHYRAGDVFKLIRERNAPIARRLGAPGPCGAELMWYESEIIIDAALACFESGFTALPLHDALLVACGPANRAKELLSNAFEDLLGVEPTIKVELFPEPAGEVHADA